YLREMAICYSDDILHRMMSMACRDPMSGIPNLEFLSVYLEELIAAEVDHDPDRAGRTSLALVVVRPPGPAMVERMTSRLLVGHLIRSAVPPELIVAHVAPERFVVVMPPLVAPETAVSSLRAALHGRREFEALKVTVIPLPRDRDELLGLVSSWRREAMKGPPITGEGDLG
ncbi:MAG TPA: hypothetical protein VNQ33_03715, partial [Acidimicrobiales bacterium]|nr:hypothetical protein [Acidimicrobiales bacterium]